MLAVVSVLPVQSVHVMALNVTPPSPENVTEPAHPSSDVAVTCTPASES